MEGEMFAREQGRAVLAGAFWLPRLASGAIGLVLLVTAGLKAYQLATEPTYEKDLFTSRWFLVILLEFELALGLLFLFNPLPRITRNLGIACFLAFSCRSFYQVLSGSNSCGCFGGIQVNPWYPLAFDLAALGFLCYWPAGLDCASITEARRSLRFVLVTLLYLVCAISTGIASSTYGPATINSQGEIVGTRSVVFLEPEAWPGQPFPLLKHIDIGGQLAKGEWIALLYRYDCPVCQEEIEHYKRLALSASPNQPTRRIAFLEVPPFPSEGQAVLSQDSRWVLGHLTKEKQWFVETPVVVSLAEGVVTQVKT